MYRILDSKKTTRFQFSIPGLREIHRNLKQQKNFKSRESFFRKSPFYTFSCINPGFGRPWDTLQKNFLIAIFIKLQKNAFGQKKNLNFMHGFKSAILEKMKNCQNGTFEPVHEICKIFWPKAFFWSIMNMPLNKIVITCSQRIKKWVVAVRD